MWIHELYQIGRRPFDERCVTRQLLSQKNTPLHFVSRQAAPAAQSNREGQHAA